MITCTDIWMNLSLLSLFLQISIVSTEDDLSWSSRIMIKGFFLFTATRSVGWHRLVPMPTVVRCSSPYTPTTCLLKCIMSLSVERMTWGNVIYNVTTTMNYVAITVKGVFLFANVGVFAVSLPPHPPPVFSKESFAIFSRPLRVTRCIWSSLGDRHTLRLTDRLCWAGTWNGIWDVITPDVWKGPGVETVHYLCFLSCIWQ